jgi:hypothetical protein
VVHDLVEDDFAIAVFFGRLLPLEFDACHTFPDG